MLNIRRFDARDLSQYDVHGCLKPGAGLVLVMFYLSRSVIVPFIAAAFGRGAEGHMEYLLQSSVATLRDLWSAIPALWVLVAWSRRLPTAGSLIRGVWRQGRWLLIGAALIDLGVRWGTQLQPPINQWLWLGLDSLAVIYLLLVPRVRQVFSDFPERPADIQGTATPLSSSIDDKTRALAAARRLARFDEHPQTKQLWQQVQDRPQDVVALWEQLALRAAGLERYVDADVLFAYLMTLQSDHGVHARNRCEVLRRLHRLPEALAVGQAAVTISPDDALAHFNLAVAAEDAGEDMLALTHYQTCLGLAPEHAAAQRQWARLQETMGLPSSFS